jgi:uncharacterized protein (DUF885 family)
MSKIKRFKGHYCKICGSYRSNESFSGKGHSRHICRKCSKLPIEKQKEHMDLNRIYGLSFSMRISKAHRKMLQDYLNNESEKVRTAAKEVLDELSEMRRMRQIELEYEDRMGLDPCNDDYLEYLEDQRLEEIEDVRIDNYEVEYEDEDEELPF